MSETTATVIGIAIIIIGLVLAIYLLRLLWRLFGYSMFAIATKWRWFKAIISTTIEPVLFLIKNGKLTVRASTYLVLLHSGSTQMDANRAALSIDTYAAKGLMLGALQHVASSYNGIRLALISDARLKGFLG